MLGRRVPSLLKDGVSLGCAYTYKRPTFVLFRKPADGSRRLVCGLATATGSRLAAGRIVCWRRRQRRPARRSSAEHEPKESIVDELAEVEVEIEESDEDGRVYEWRVERLSGLGLSHVIASAVASFV